MQMRIRKWGNSLAVRIPKLYALEAALEEDTLVEIFVDEGKLIIFPTSPSPQTLDDLLSQITPENLHHEVESGVSVGNEAW